MHAAYHGASVTHVDASKKEVNLRSHLFDNYQKDTRPVKNVSQPVNVDMGLAIQTLEQFNQKTETIKLNIWFRMNWYNEYLNWENTNGAFYAFVELKTINDTWKFCEDLIVNKSILALPGTIFGDQWGSYLRIAYGSVTPDEIEEGIQRIEEFITHTT